MIEKVFFRTLIFFGLIIIIYIGFLYFSKLDESIRSGKGYGFEIGMSKKEAYEVIIKKYGEDFVRYRIYQGKDYKGTHSFDLSRISYDNLNKYSEWELYFHKVSWNYISLEFHKNELVAIHRFRQYYELP